MPMNAVDLYAREEIEKLRVTLGEMRSTLNRALGVASRSEQKVDGLIGDVRDLKKTDLHMTEAMGTVVTKLDRMYFAFRKEFGSLSGDIGELEKKEAERAKSKKSALRLVRKLAVGAAVAFAAVVGGAAGIAFLKHCNLPAPNSVEVSP